MNILFFLTPKENVSYIQETDNLWEALEKLQKHGYSAIPLLSKDGKYIGTLTEGDILWGLKEKGFPEASKLKNTSITAVKRRRDNQAVNVLSTIEDVFQKVTNQNFVPVVDDNKVFIGIVTRKDILLYLAKQLKDSRNS